MVARDGTSRRLSQLLLRLGMAASLQVSVAAGRDGWVELRAAPPTDCITVDDVESELQARTARAADLAATDPTFRVALVLERYEEGVRGTVTLTRDGAASERQVEGKSCRQVAEALLLVTALAIDPSANTEKRSEAPVPSSAQTIPAVSRPAATVSKPPPNARAISSAADSPPRSAQRSPSIVRLGLLAGMRAGPLPAPAPLAGGLIEWEKESRWAPELRVALYASTSVQNRLGIGQASFRLIAGRLDACGGSPLGPLRLRGCAAAEVGILHGSAEASPALQRTRASSRPWLAGGALAELTLPLRPVALAARGGILAPAIRDQFVRVLANGEQTQFHQPSVVGAVVEVSAAFAL